MGDNNNGITRREYGLKCLGANRPDRLQTTRSRPSHRPMRACTPSMRHGRKWHQIVPAKAPNKAAKLRNASAPVLSTTRPDANFFAFKANSNASITRPSIPDLDARTQFRPRLAAATFPTSRHSKPLRIFRLWAVGSPGLNRIPITRHSKPLRLFRLWMRSWPVGAPRGSVVLRLLGIRCHGDYFDCGAPQFPNSMPGRNLDPRRPGQTPTSRRSNPMRIFRLWAGRAGPLRI